MSALYCVGCGRLVAVGINEGTLAISCTCGAYSPLLARALDDPSGLLASMPASLIRVIKGDVAKGALPHVETYLGYSGGTNLVRRFWDTQLRAIGLTSAADCERSECRDRYARMTGALT